VQTRSPSSFLSGAAGEPPLSPTAFSGAGRLLSNQSTCGRLRISYWAVASVVTCTRFAQAERPEGVSIMSYVTLPSCRDTQAKIPGLFTNTNLVRFISLLVVFCPYCVTL